MLINLVPIGGSGGGANCYIRSWAGLVDPDVTREVTAGYIVVNCWSGALDGYITRRYGLRAETVCLRPYKAEKNHHYGQGYSNTFIAH
mgnify:CR=1 FL=1